jgi:F5/8 type C domain
MTDFSRLRKRQLRGADATAGASAANRIDIIAATTIAYSSEDPAHPIEHAFDGCSGPGATRWISARDNTVEHIVIEFDRPQIISLISYEVEERAVERTQEVRGEISDDAGRTYRQILFRIIPSAREAPPINAKSNVTIASRSVVSVLRLFPTRMAGGVTLTTLRLFT